MIVLTHYDTEKGVDSNSKFTKNEAIDDFCKNYLTEVVARFDYKIRRLVSA